MMIVLLHVLIAISSLVYTTYLLFAPARSKFKAAYTLVALTLLSGFGLIVITHSPILQTCISGLTFLAINSVGLAVAHYRLAAQESNRNDQL